VSTLRSYPPVRCMPAGWAALEPTRCSHWTGDCRAGATKCAGMLVISMPNLLNDTTTQAAHYLRFTAPLARLLVACVCGLARLAKPPGQDPRGSTRRGRRSRVVHGRNDRTTQARRRSTPSIAPGPTALFKQIAATPVCGVTARDLIYPRKRVDRAGRKTLRVRGLCHCWQCPPYWVTR